jgi:sugar phosphate permease
VPFEQAATFFGAVLVVSGLVGTLLGGFAATAWQKRNPAGYALVNGLSVLASVPVALVAFLSSNTVLTMSALGLAMFLLFLSTGPVNTLIIESVPVNLRSSAMALSIFMIHLFGDMWSSEIVGHLSDHWQSLQKAVLILPVALLVSGLLWQLLAMRILRQTRQNQIPLGG